MRLCSTLHLLSLCVFLSQDASKKLTYFTAKSWQNGRLEYISFIERFVQFEDAFLPLIDFKSSLLPTDNLVFLRPTSRIELPLHFTVTPFIL